MIPTWQQIEFMKAAQKPGCRVAVSSGHGTGKSRAYAVFCDWALRVYPLSNTLLTASAIEQVRSVVWKELEDLKGGIDSRYPWMAPFFIKETKRYYALDRKDSWFVLPRTAAKSKPESIAGQHRKWYTVLIDEASGVDDAVIEVLRGALTEDENRFIMVSQFTRTSGHFAEAFGSLAELYTTMQFNSELSPIVSKRWIAEKLKEYGGHHSPEYQIRVLGRRADNLSGMLIPRSWCETAQNLTIDHQEPWGWVITVDVGEGVYRDSSVYTVARVSGYDEERRVEPVAYEEFNDMDPKAFGRLVHQRSLDYPYVTIAVDSDGPGLATALELEDLGANVVRIHWGRPPHSDKAKKRYQDMRAYACVMSRLAIFEERMKLVGGSKILDQASQIPYSFDRRGRYVIMPKTQMATQGIKSPDIFDTHCFFFLCNYNQVDENGGGQVVDQDDWHKWAQEIIEGE